MYDHIRYSYTGIDELQFLRWIGPAARQGTPRFQSQDTEEVERELAEYGKTAWLAALWYV